ncbi:DUF2586 family protein [Larkinella sp. VNQ87]|uniref:DUF2586 family protein n=1 Tax=Larkinella sp. VNQ87 TaxID=3400921 RepID=UPI003C11460D
MAQPKVDIQIQSGGLGRSTQVADGVAGLVVTGVAATGLALGVAKRLFSLADAEDVGIKSDVPNLLHAWTQINDFFAFAGDGAELWIILIANTTTLVSAVGNSADDSTPLEKLLVAAEGRVNVAGVSMGRAAGYTPSLNQGFDGNVQAAVGAAQMVAEKFYGRYSPVHIILDGSYMDPAGGYINWRQGGTANRVSCFVGTDVAGARVSCMGKLLGRLASIPVQRNIGRVKDGSFMADAYLTSGVSVRSLTLGALNAIHDAGYILPRIHQGIPGVFLSDDPSLVDNNDDFSSISRNRVIGKAVRLTYQTYVLELLDEVEVQANGRISPTKIGYLEGRIENAINQQMVVNGNCSSVDCTIDPRQNILSTDRLEIQLKLIPVGQLKEIVIKLGFTNPALAT